MALIALCLWVVLAWLLMITLTARQSWPAAYGLIAIGVPILVWLWLSLGIFWAALGLLTMGITLRWPVIYFTRWVKRSLRKADPDQS